ncbi:MAG: DUF881 domain-containing protein [Actinobacteria bacterium]|nr:DUF881 domain-containing protein [Actinomycetota bacterium]
MNDHARPGRRLRRGSFAVAAVLAAAGLLFVANAVSAHGTGRSPQDLAELARAQAARVATQAADVDRLRAQVGSLAAQAADVPVSGDGSVADQVASGSTAVVGPGLEVTLDDAPSDSLHRDGVSADVLVVHQQDIQSVVNALWAGGAEAVAIQDQRLITTSAIRCVGNVLRLHGQLYSPPYTVSAIGDGSAMKAALAASPAVQAYRRDAVEVGLGWEVDSQDALTLPAYSGATDLDYASLPGGVDPLTGRTTAPASPTPSPASPTPSAASPTPSAP